MDQRTITSRTPGKINLWLEVLGKREDGYHELSSLMLPIGIHDTLTLRVGGERGVRVRCGHPLVPCDRRNLVVRAVEAYLSETDFRQGVDIHLEKGIPVSAGLGGGSADAGAALQMIHRLVPEPLPEERLLSIARGIGADVAFFLDPYPALASGIGEKLEKVPGLPDYPLVLIKPDVAVSTREVYGSLKLTRGVSRIKLQAFVAKPWEVQGFLENDLETVTFSRLPELGAIKSWLLEHGALGALMSGSGPTMFGVYPSMADAQRAEALAGKVWGRYWVAVTSVMAAGNSP
ncbi:MAG TPA: 4-(cytidine 5'-diphospho)-2-C-methyl-D-erythritol kinase [Syntrophobacteraceae bacterium]|nr:4-(cytidine 5'-diphospho)-2-C-methyl-D-erythritol kinase [Syntrophobacteraceae bacterium]